MSKSKGNVIDPWMMFATPRRRRAALELPLRRASRGRRAACRTKASEKATRKTLLTLWNVFSFFATYADLDGWTATPTDESRADATCSTGGSSASSTTRSQVVTDALDGVRRARRLRRASPRSSTTSRTGTCAAAGPASGRAPIRKRTPRCTDASSPARSCSPRSARSSPDEIYIALTGELSVHTSDWPSAGPSDPALAAEMQAVRRLVTVGRAARAEAKAKVRQPLATGAAAPPRRRALRSGRAPRSPTS